MVPATLDRRDAALASLIALAALVTRVTGALLSPFVRFDGSRYWLMTLHFQDGRWNDGLSVWPRMPPLLPMLMWLFGHGVGVCIVCGALAVVPLYLLAREVWGREVAVLSAGIAAVLPEAVITGSQVATEPVFCLMLFSALE